MPDEFDDIAPKYEPPAPARPLPLTPTSRVALESACVAMFDILSHEIEFDFGLVGPEGQMYVQPTTKWGQLVRYLSMDETRNRLASECVQAVEQEIASLENPEFKIGFELPRIYKI